jgi:NAD-dependent deacetylase
VERPRRAEGGALMPESRRTPSYAGLRRELIDAAAYLMTQARSILFITGPGLASDSGLPHYRGMPGLLKRKAEDAKAFELALSAEMMQRQPTVAWRYLLEMDAAVTQARPSRGHEVLVLFERAMTRTSIMTMNVDRLHQRAGSRNVIEMHGALHDLLCPRCEVSRRIDSFAALAIPPACATCGTALRPDMPLFGETLPQDPATRLQIELDAGFDMVVSIGIASMYPYIARPILLAKSQGLPTVEIGATHTDVSEVVDFRFRGTPSRVLELVWDAYRQLAQRN